MIVTNKHNLPSSIVRAVTNDQYTGPQADTKCISVTTLINPPRIHFIKCKHWDEITEDVVDSIWKVLGSAAHAIMERSEGKQDIVEERLNKEVNGITISGAFDLYDSTTKEIHDYKTTSAWTIVYNPLGKDEWVQQQNIYAWLLESIGFPVLGMKIIAILRDWSEGNYTPGGKYPEIPICIINLPKWSKEEVEKYINDRVALYKSCQAMKESELPFCDSRDMWEKFEIMKVGRITPVKKFDNEKEAIAFMPKDGKHKIVSNRGRCLKYCQAAPWCNQYQQYLKEKGVI